MMTEVHGEQPLALGFLTVVDQPSQGLIGGYLLLNAHARPLEFHCTVPVRANRAQEILYGTTLEPYLYGEQIGSTLIKTSGLRPAAVFTDLPPALAAAEHIAAPLWLVMPPDDAAQAKSADDGNRSSISSSAQSPDRVDRAHRQPADLAMSRWGRNCLARRAGQTGARDGGDSTESDDERLAQWAGALDLFEPFERIRAAIQESQRGWR
ncbi:MAG TPA: hypothetical protein VGN12_13705 [Pirellulales bacterium]|jgi:hypothetical protein